MIELIALGKKRTILISISIILVSIHTIYFYHIVRPEIDTKKLFQQIIRLILTLGLLRAVYKGVKWVKTLTLVLFTIAVFIGLISFVTINMPFVNKIPIVVMIFVYSMAIHHFGFSESYQAFFDFQNRKEDL